MRTSIPSQFELVVLQGPDAGARVALDHTVRVVGRAREADLALHDVRVSRRHLEVSRADARVRVRVVPGAQLPVIDGRARDEADVDVGARIAIGRSLLGVFAATRESRDTGNAEATDVRSLVSGVAFDIRAVVGLYELLEALPGAHDLRSFTEILGVWGAANVRSTRVRVVSPDSHDLPRETGQALARTRELVALPAPGGKGSLVFAPARADVARWIAFDLPVAADRVNDSARRQLALAGAVCAAPLARLFALRASEDERRSLRELAVGTARKFLGTSEKAVNVGRLIERVAECDSAVLLQGESGGGKSFVARLIHESSARAREPFRVINCAAIPEALFESELFGHERGAFTGAVRAHEGALSATGKGTLLLDEVGELPLASQSKLLRVLEERRFERVGSTRPIALEARVLLATNRNLVDLVKAERFRADLYFRVAVVTVTIPSLRERVGDIPELARHLLADMQASGLRGVAGFTEDALRAMARYSWPGNVRELRNAIERAVVLGEGETIDSKDLSFGDLTETPAAAENGTVRLPVNAAWLEDENIDRALRATGGNRTRAAAILGIDRSTLFRKRPPE